MTKKKDVEVFSGVSNDAENMILSEIPYRAVIELVGTEKLLMHCWSNAVVSEKSGGKKNTAKKKTDDIESYVLRDEKDRIVIPTLNFCAAIREAGKSFQDPTSPRKSLRDRLKAVIIPGEEYGLMNGGVKAWDFIDARRVVIQRAGITRSRPGFEKGWTIKFEIIVLEPEYINKELLFSLVETAGKFQALGDFRPTFGRFRVNKFEIVSA